MKTHAKIDGIPPWVIFEVIANPDIRRLWDKAICNFEILEDIPSEGRSLLYYMVKTPIGVSNRDFLQQRKVKKDFPSPGTITMHFKSVVDDARCPEKPKTIRAETIISGYIIAPQGCGGGTELTVVSQNDIKGVIPLTLVNTGASKAPRQWVGNMLNACQEYMKKN